MATRDTYEVQTWENLPSDNTPVSAERLSHIEQGIKDAMDNRALEEIYGDKGTNIGDRNIVSGTYTANYIIIGYDNISDNFSSGIIVGTGNKGENGGSGICTGSNNTIRGGATFIAGQYNETNEGACGAIGQGLIAVAEQVAVGSYNEKDERHQYRFIVGGGTSDTNRKNVHTIDKIGNAYFAGDVTNGAGASLNGLKTALDNIQSSYMTYEETTTALNSQETGEINKIPNIYAIRDWCKALINPSEEV